MEKFFTKISLALKDAVLRRRLIFTAGILIIGRLLAAVPIPGVDTVRLESLLSGNQFLGFLNIFSGGGIANLSIVMLGVAPYITASIIMQVMTMISPKLKAMYHEEGEAGRKKFSQTSRLLAVPLAFIQGFSFIILLERQGILPSLQGFDFVVNIIVIVAGAMLLMWLGELITEFGIGNGVSLLIFSGIVASLPQTASQAIFAFNPSQIPTLLAFLIVLLVITFSVVFITEAERPIPVTYARRVRGNKVFGGVSTYLPLRLNQAGVIPIIFALSIIILPQMLFNFLSVSQVVILKKISDIGLALINNGWLYSIAYFVLVFVFTYFYTAVTFDPDSISDNLQKGGAFIPGVRPGKPTSEYLSNVITRITAVGALFLGFIAVLPIVMQRVTGFTYLAIGGTALLIVVSVVLDLVKRLDAQVSMREY